MLNSLKQWLVFGRLSANEIIFQKEIINGNEETIIIVDKWPFLRHDFISCLTMYSAKDTFSWAGITKNNTRTGDIEKLKGNIISFWNELNLEHRYDKIPYQDFFIKVIFPLLKDVKINDQLRNYSDSDAIAIVLMLTEWERSFKPNAVLV